MGQSNARQRLQTIKENVNDITDRIKSDDLTSVERDRSHVVLIDYIKEVNLILSKSLRPGRVRQVEKLIIAALEELAILEGKMKYLEPRLKAKSMQALHEIENDMKAISATLASKKLEDKESVVQYKKRLSMIDDYDQEVGAKKNKVLDVVERTFSEIEVEEQLKDIEERHSRTRIDLNRFVGVSESNCYKKYKEQLLVLRKEITQIVDVSHRIKLRKEYLLFNIDNNRSALEIKVKENEEQIKKKMISEENFRPTSPTVGNKKLIDEVVLAYSEFEKTFSAKCSLEELQDVFEQLTNLKIKIDQKINVLENQLQDVRLPLENPTLIINKMSRIQSSVEDLLDEIRNYKHDQNISVYNNYKKELKDCKFALENLNLKEKEDQTCSNNILKKIDDAVELLENNRLTSRIPASDQLEAVKSVGSIVYELGARIKEATATEEFETIEQNLLANLYYLKKLEVPGVRSTVCQSRDYLVIQIESLMSNVEKKKRSLNEQAVMVFA